MATEKEIIMSLAGFVATQMTALSGTEWRAFDRVGSAGADLKETETGATIFVRFGMKWADRDRVTFQSWYPEGTRRQVSPDPEEFKTSVSRDRDPHQIAAQVLRKIAVPAFFAEWKRCVTELAEDDAAVTKRDDLHKALVNAFTVDWVQSRSTDDEPTKHERIVDWWRRSVDGGRVDVSARINHDASQVRLLVDELTPDQAARVLELVATFYN